MDLEADLVHGGWFLEADDDMNFHQVPSYSQDSGVFSDDESRETVCLSPEPEDLLSTLEEHLTLSPELTVDTDKVHQDQGKEDSKYHEETFHSLQPNRSSSLGNYIFGDHSLREPLGNISLRRSSSLENTMIQLDLSEQATVRRTGCVSSCNTDKENVVDYKSKPKQSLIKKDTDEVKNNCSNSGINNIFDAGYTETCTTSSEQGNTDQTSLSGVIVTVPSPGEMGNTSPVEQTAWEPPKLVRLKCLSHGEKFRQMRLPDRDEFKPEISLSYDGFQNKLKKSAKRKLSFDSSPYDSPERTRNEMSENAEGPLKRNLSSDGIKISKRQKTDYSEENNTSLISRPSTSEEHVFKVPECPPIRKRSKKSAGGSKPSRNPYYFH